MKYYSVILFSLLLLSLAACSSGTSSTPATIEVTPTLAQPGVNSTQAPDVNIAVRKYLDAWENEDYPLMYGMLTSLSKDAISEEEFTEIYREVAAGGALSSLDTQIISALTQTRNSQASFSVTMQSALVGEVQRDTMMNLQLEDGEWHIEWKERT